MAVYSYYYGASVERGITIQAQSPELMNLPIQSMLKELAAMHSLDAGDQPGEMLSYMLSAGGFTVLGTSYTESPKSSGYNRSAPCGLMYVAPTPEVEASAVNLGRIVNFANFQKPHSSNPAPMREFPVNESGYSYHNAASVMAPLVDGLLRIAFSEQNEVLLVALPRGKNSGYAAARYAIAEALGCMPVWLRTRINFFTGLPVGDSENDPLRGFDNAIKFGANVIFCSGESFARLKSHRACIALDMERPTEPVGAFAEHITRVADVSANLSMVNSCINGQQTYDALNKAVAAVKRGEIQSVDAMQKQLAKVTADAAAKEKKLNEFADANNRWKTTYGQLDTKHKQLEREYQKLENSHKQLEHAYNNMLSYGNVPTGGQAEPEQKKSKALLWVVNIFCAVLLVAASVFATTIVTKLIAPTDIPAPNTNATSPMNTVTPVPGGQNVTQKPTEPAGAPANSPAGEEPGLNGKVQIVDGLSCVYNV